MNRVLVAAVATVTIVLAVPAAAQAPTADPSRPAIVDLGNQRYRIGTVTIDKATSSFTVPGRVLKLDSPTAPLEFLIAARDGVKAYESLIEVDATGFEINLACILIGLTARPDSQPKKHFDPAPVTGDSISVTVSWQAPDGGMRTVMASEMIALADGTSAADEWVYTGSWFNGGIFMANEIGTVVGFVHDMDSLIQHRSGLGLGNYGAVVMNTGLTPAAETPVTLEIKRLP